MNGWGRLATTSATPPELGRDGHDELPLFAAACAAGGVPFALHVFPRRRHGVGLAQDDPALRAWPELLTAWLKAAV